MKKSRGLLSGANGFLGQYIYAELSKIFEIDTVSRSNSTYNVDLSLAEPSLHSNYEVIIHNAGKAHSIPKTQKEIDEFFEVNVNGTLNLLNSLSRRSIPEYFVLISSVSVYGRESGDQIDEQMALVATDPYGKSKIQAEKLVWDWCTENKVKCSILRLPLLVGVNPPGNLKSMINGIKSGFYFNIKGGSARKSMVLAEDVSKIIPSVLKKGGIYNLTDGYHPTFAELSGCIAKQLGKSKPMSIPGWAAEIMAKIGDVIGDKAPINSVRLRKITSSLTFNDIKARNEVGWNPNLVLEKLKIN